MKDNFEFKTVDEEGMEILDVIAKADKFNKWMFETIKPHCKGKVLEIGSGIGNISQFFLADSQFQIQLTDIRDNYCDRLKQKFASSKNLLGVENIDLVDPNFDTKYSSHLEKYDTVFALNVVEHIKEDNLAIANAKKMLVKGGKLIILVPAYQALYNQFDTSLEHYRRYTKKNLNPLFVNNKLEIVHSQYFNAIGIAGWYVSGKLQKNDSIPEGQMGLYNKLVPVFKIADKLIFNKLGLSVITVGKK
jgi:2-polyprenyl-3-methyl-5-hydroxy-6-metoxy-1,4-benzoquinol methylase